MVERAITIVNGIKESAFLKQNFVFFLGGMAIGVLNYAYYPVLGRLMPPAAFGEVQALISLFLQAGIFLMVLSMIAVNITANYKDEQKRNQVIFELEKAAVIIGAVFLLVIVLFGEQIRRALQFDSVVPFLLLAVGVLVMIPATFRGAFLRGKQHFGLASINGIIGASCKLIFSVLLVSLGFSTGGAITGIILANLVALAYIAVYARKYGLRLPAGKYFKKPDLKLILPELKYAGLVLMTSVAVMFLCSADVLFAKYFFDPHTAGLYAGVSTVSRIIFFATISIAAVLLSAVKINASAKANQKVLKKSFMLLILLALPVLVLFTVFPHFFIQLFMGDKYLAYADLLRYLTVTMFIVSVINMFLTYYVALRQYAVGIIAIIGIIVTLVCMLLWHGSLRDIVQGLFIGSLTTVGLLALWAVVPALKRGRIG